jgi:hypothetical protein
MAEHQSNGDRFDPDRGEHALLDFDHHREERHRAMQIQEREDAERASRTGVFNASRSPARWRATAGDRRSRTRTR